MEQIKKIEKSLIEALPTNRKEQTFYSFIECNFENYLKQLNSIPEKEMNNLLTNVNEILDQIIK